MVIKKYIASTQEEAEKLAKDELGENVVIMNVKKTAPKGIYKFFKKASVEITAAVDENETVSSDASKETEDKVPDFSKLQQAIQEKQDIPPAPDSKAAQKEAKKELLVKNNQILADESEKETSSTVSDKKDIEERLSNLQDLLEKQMQVVKEENEEKEEKENASKPYYDLIRQKLLDSEVEETYANQLIDDIAASLDKNATLDNILAGIYQKIILKIGQPHLIDINTKKTKYIFFVGPTGVGKTTTIAKIASTLKLTKKTKVALITSDTYRIAAVEQLKTYANILGIPLKVIYSTEDMAKTMEDLQEYDLVFVDTAGRSHNNMEQREDIRKLIDTVDVESREVFLVLSATTKYKDLVKISQSYSEITKYNLIFTKLDETDTVGNIFNIHMLTGAPLSYTTWGQNVPDDIGKIDAQSMAKQLLGGNN